VHHYAAGGPGQHPLGGYVFIEPQGTISVVQPEDAVVESLHGMRLSRGAGNAESSTNRSPHAGGIPGVPAGDQ
jgi:hypothetical protein